MKNDDERDQEALRNRLSRRSAASLRIHGKPFKKASESLDPDTVWQEILDRARSLTDTRYGVIAACDDPGQGPFGLWPGGR